jgi:DNA-binding transcriptional LysR family regulator
MELRQLQYFVVLAEELHFGRAAERLHIGQPAMSQQIRALERSLGVQLLDRSPRHVRLTEVGDAFLAEATKVLDAVERARASVRGASSAPRTLRLGTTSGLGERLGLLLDSFAELCPQVEVDLVSLPSPERIKQIIGGRLDAAFVRGIEADPRLCVVPAWEEPLVVALPAGHPLAQRPDVAISELADIPLRLTSRRTNPVLVDLIIRACADAGFEPMSASAFPNLQDTITAMGAGRPSWTVLYAAHARQLRTSRVAFLPVRTRKLAIRTDFAYSTARKSPHIDTVLKIIKDLPAEEATTAICPR